MKPLLAFAVCAAVVPLSACDDTSETDDGRLQVAVAFYPLEEMVRRVGGDEIAITTLVPAGNEAHEFEPTPRQVTRLEDADIVFYLGSNFQPSLQKAIEALPDSVRTVDLLDGLTLQSGADGVDPHVWLDPRNMESMTQAILVVLGGELPEQALTFASNEVAYIDELAVLHNDFTAGLSDCAAPVLITTHQAFAYLAIAYDLTYRAIAGVSPGDEPSAQSLEDLADFAAQQQISTIFYEANLPSDLAETVASEIGGDTAGLATAETLTQSQLDAGESYVSLMRENLVALRNGMSCT